MNRRRLWLALAAAAVIAGGAILALLWPKAPPPIPRKLALSDGTEVFFLSDTQVHPSPTYPHPRELRINGDAFIRAADAPEPLILRSRLLVITVTGASDVRVTAWSHQTGEQVSVLSGHAEARKAYPSTYNEPDVLDSGQISMVNETIDLMEKETLKPHEVQALKDAFDAAVEGRFPDRG